MESLAIGADSVVLDIGGRDAFHGLLMAERFGCRVMSVDPAPANIASGLKAVAEHEHGHLVDVHLGAMERIPADDGQFDLVFSRDMWGHVVDADAGLAECVRVLAPGGAMLVYAVFNTELMEPTESERLCRETATLPERTSSISFEEGVRRAGFAIETVDMVGSEFYEANQEAGTSPNYALQISRLRRAKDELVDELGEFAYRSMYANALYGVYMLIGKLETRIYVLRKTDS